MSADAAARVPRIAIVGRQNVGKSTLANRLFGGREAIAHDLPGVTRDRVELEAVWRGRRFGLVDTAGFLTGPAASRRWRVPRPTARSLTPTSSCWWSTPRPASPKRTASSRAGCSASPCRCCWSPTRSIRDREEADAATFNALGLGEPFAVSGMHGRATGDLLDRIVELLPDAPASTDRADPLPRFAIVGPAERRQVQPVQPLDRTRAHGRLARCRHHPRCRRRRRGVAGRPRSVRRHRRHAPSGEGAKGWSTSASSARLRRSIEPTSRCW